MIALVSIKKEAIAKQMKMNDTMMIGDLFGVR